MAYDSYKLTQTTSTSNPRTQMLDDKIKQVTYLYDLSTDREDGCLLNGNAFIQSPRVFDRKYNSSSVQSITVETIDENDKFYTGDYLSYDNDIWLCTSSFEFHSLYCKGNFTRCSYTLKFQSPDGTILSYPCIDESSNTIGIDETSSINTLKGIHRIKLPFDDNTKLIKVDKRFFISKCGTATYAVTDVNDTEFNFGDKGLIVLTLKASTLQETDGKLPKDRQDLGICNYFSPTVPPTPTPSPSGYTLTISTSGDFNLGTTRTLTPTLKDSLGNVVATWTAVWSVNYNGMDQNLFDVDDTIGNNKCSVEVLDEAYDVIDGVLELTCTVSGDTVSATYSGTITA